MEKKKIIHLKIDPGLQKLKKENIRKEDRKEKKEKAVLFLIPLLVTVGISASIAINISSFITGDKNL